MGTIKITPEELRIAELAIDNYYMELALVHGVHVDSSAAASGKLQLLARRLERDGREALEFEHPRKEGEQEFIPAKGVQA